VTRSGTNLQTLYEREAAVSKTEGRRIEPIACTQTSRTPRATLDDSRSFDALESFCGIMGGLHFLRRYDVHCGSLGDAAALRDAASPFRAART